MQSELLPGLHNPRELDVAVFHLGLFSAVFVKRSALVSILIGLSQNVDTNEVFPLIWRHSSLVHKVQTLLAVCSVSCALETNLSARTGAQESWLENRGSRAMLQAKQPRLLLMKFERD